MKGGEVLLMGTELYFTSIPLLNRLKKKGLLAPGTINTNRMLKAKAGDTNMNWSGVIKHWESLNRWTTIGMLSRQPQFMDYSHIQK